MALWNGLGQAATIAQLAGMDAAGLISMIVQAVQTVQRNKVECQQLVNHVMMISDLLQLHQQSETMRRPEIRRALDGLENTLREAYMLVTSCQESNIMYRFITAGNRAQKLRDIRDRIDLYLRIYPMIGYIETRYLITGLCSRIHPSGAEPQATAEMEIYGSHSTTGGAARSVEYGDEIITMVTTGTEASSAPSSKFSLSATVATHHISEENIDGGSRYTIAYKLVIKMQMTCDKSRGKAMALMGGAVGVQSVAADDGKGQVVVVGYSLDPVYLISLLRKNVAYAELLAVVPAKQAEEAQQEPATRWPRTRIRGGIRAITAKLSRFMRRRPRSSTTCQAAPSSSPLLMEYTDTPAPAPTIGPWPHLFPGESSSSMTFSAATPPAFASTSTRSTPALQHAGPRPATSLRKPDLLLLQHQPAAPPATAPVRHRRRTFKIHRSVRLPAVRQSRMMPPAKRIEASSFERSGARVLLPLMSCALCALVLLASVWALR